MRRFLMLAALAAAMPVMAQQSAAPTGLPQTTAVVTTQGGRVQGLKDRGISVFKGLRYGRAPVGPLRFRPPVRPAPEPGIIDATGFGAPAIQLYTPAGDRTSDFTRQVQLLFPTATEDKTDSEDCLFLNVWTPAPDMRRRPVMVWIHGGGYNYGSGAWPAYDGRNLAAKGDVVVVTVNHRLNAFGYLDLADKFGPEFAQSGNVGNLDLVASLEWVRDNIAAFGGDPGNVTIMGESGGGAKVSALLATPAARGLFHKAVIQSGPGLTGIPRATAQALTEAVLKEAGIATVAQLRAAPSDTIIAAVRAVSARAPGGEGARFGPVVDGVVLPRDPFVPAAPDQSRDIPVLIGWNKDEMTLFTASQPWFGVMDDAGLDRMATSFGPQGPALVSLYRRQHPTYSPTHIANLAMSSRFVAGSYLLADAKAAQRGAPVYVYRLTYDTPVNGGVFKTPHTLDIPFMFDNVEAARVLVGPGAGPVRMGRMMSDAWIAFARTGTPASPLLPRWQPYTPTTRNVMELNLRPRLTVDPDAQARSILASGAR